MRLLFVTLLLALSAFACKGKGSSSGTEGGGAVDLVAKGKAAYMANCTACHNSDPKKAGPLGPDVFGSSLELLASRIMKAEYPAGYKPKRETKQMAAIPQLQADIPAIHAFINAQ